MIGCVAAAAVLIALGSRWTKTISTQDQPAATQSTVAKAEGIEGRVTRKSWSQDLASSLLAGDAIRHLDRTFIESRSHLEVSLKGYRLRVLGPGEIIFEQWSPSDPASPVVMHLISGHLDMLTEGERGKVYVTKDRQLTDPKGASLPVERGLIISSLGFSNSGLTLPTVTEAQTATGGTVSMAGENDSEPLPGSLTNAYLDGVIAQEQEQFQRCQANSLRDHSDAKGQVVVGMTISPDGRVSDLHVMTSTIQDDKLHGCILQIFSRLKFRPFQGAAIVRSYPLTFE